MLASYNLLNEFIDLSDITPEELCDKLTFSGFEVEGSKKMAYADKLCVGHVISCLPHPDSDHLHVLKVDCGQEGVLNIVCGAPNVCLDAYVIVALVGCNLKAIDVTIKAGVIRGEESNGMCCSLLELGVDKSVLTEEDTKGIHLLPSTCRPGDKNVLKLLNLDDTVIDINVLANRPDCLSILGLARELSALLNRPLKAMPRFDFNSAKTQYEVCSETDSCDLFTLIELDNVKNGKSPRKLVAYLNAMGIRSVDLIVDIGNFSMLVTGQPLHMYDLDKVDGNKLIVTSSINSMVKALDDKEYQIIDGDVVIKDLVKPCCIGGVMGLKDVEIDSSTTHIGIEAAHFYHAAIRHTSKRLGLSSDSSSLFIKGTNPYIVDEGLEITMSIIMKMIEGVKYCGKTSFNNVKPLKDKFAFSVDNLNHRLGSAFMKKEVTSLLNRIGLKFDDNYIYTSKYRLDLVEQCDIDEEVFRFNDPSRCIKTIAHLPQTVGERNDSQLKVKRIKDRLVSLGFNQIISYTLINKKEDRFLRVFDNENGYVIKNPMTNDHEVIRTDLLASLVKVIKYNLDRKNDNLRMFEISSVERPQGNKTYLSIGLVGESLNRGMLETKKYDFFDMKGIVTEILSMLNLDEKRYSLVRSTNSSFHPGRAADVVIGKNVVATFGEINPSLKMDYVLAELDLSFLMSQRSSKLKCSSLSSIQPIRKDLAFNLLDISITSDSIIKEIRKAGGQYVKGVDVFDEFIKDGKRSLAFSIILQKDDKSFTDAEISSLLNTIILNVTHKLKVELKSA